MRVTRSWLQEYLNLDGIDNSTLVETFNKIGLEVEEAKEYKIPANVVVGKVIHCQKHPNADKLNLCEVDVGEERLQIICGAANVVNAKFVAVAKIGALLPGDFKIKKAKLRGIESFGMICSSTELGLPKMEDGIMILDESIGKLIVGKELREYEKLNDFVIEYDVTPNRGDALSIMGAARDLAAALNKEFKKKSFLLKTLDECALNVEVKEPFIGKEEFCCANLEEFDTTLLMRLRLALLEQEYENALDAYLKYAFCESNVILRAYDKEKISAFEITKEDKRYVLKSNNEVVSIIGLNQNRNYLPSSKTIIFEASYIHPDLIAGIKCESDGFAYNSTRGSEADVTYALKLLQSLLQDKGAFSQIIKANLIEPQKREIIFEVNEVNEIVGNEFEEATIIDILKRLGFEVEKKEDKLYVKVPLYFHDIKNVADISEEIVRIYGIDKIEAKPLEIVEKNRLNEVFQKYQAKKELCLKAVGAGFFEAITYAFANKESLQKYGYKSVQEEKELLNPIVSELSTLRPTITLNLIEAASKNVKYGQKSIALFEIGRVFDNQRRESDKLCILFSGESERANVSNKAKAKTIDYPSFAQKVSQIIGDFSVKNCEAKNALMHPYQSGVVIKEGKEIGVIFKLHPKVAKAYDLDDTYLCEVNLDEVLAKEKTAKEYSNYQPTTKDLSLLIDENILFFDVAKALKSLQEQERLIKDFYPLDIYKDEKFGKRVSLTIRFTLQSMEHTLSDEEIEEIMNKILAFMKEKFNAELR